MRIALVSGSSPPMRCGVGDYTDALARALAQQPGAAVALLSSQAAEDQAAPDDEPFERFATIRGWSFGDIAAARRMLHAWRPDIVHLQHPTQGYSSQLLPSLIPLLAWRAGAVPVRTWHEAFSGRRSAQFLLQSAAPGPAIVVRPNFAELMWPPLRPLLGMRQPTLIAGASSIPLSTLGPDGLEHLRRRYLAGQSRLIAFFGFLHRIKGVEQLFEIADPSRDALVIAGEMHDDDAYRVGIHALADADRWRGKVAFTGHMPSDRIADLLAAADVVVLPFVKGGGSWNSSISAAVLQETPVVTTSAERRGVDATGRVHFAPPNDVTALRRSLNAALQPRVGTADTGDRVDDWARIADEHMAVYRAALAVRGGAN